MKSCPFCGADLSDNASFCPHCTTSLIEKTNVKPYRTFPLRKLLFLLIPVLISGGLLLLLFRKEASPSPTPDSSGSSVSVSDIHATDDATRTGGSANGSFRPQSNVIATPGTTDAASEHSTESDRNEPEQSGKSSANSTDDRPSQTTAGPTQTATDTPAASTDTTGSSQTGTDAPAASTNTPSEPETDDSPEEEYTAETAPLKGTYTYRGVEWCYETPSAKHPDYPYEPYEMAHLTGVNNLSADGIYYVPETVHGKHVVLLKQPLEPQAKYNIDSLAFRKSAKVLYLPPDVYGMPTGTLTTGTALTDIYIAGDDFYLTLPNFMGDSLTIHSKKDCIYTGDSDRPLMKDACTIYPKNFTCTWKEWDPSTLYPQS